MAHLPPTDNGSRPRAFRVAAVGDVHCSRTPEEILNALFAEMAAQADVILLCGDLTDYGRPEEGRQLLRELEHAGGVPVLAVLGNHDYECARHEELERVLSEGGVTVLNGTPAEVGGVGFVGVKGFAGGFDERSLQPWGEEIIKRFVHEAVDEALKLESALAKLQTVHRIVLLHYSPLAATVRGEPPEIYPFLGSSRLEEPLNRYPVTAVFHGHAHHGSPEGRTKAGVPVYNVAMPVLRETFPNQAPFRLIEVPADAADSPPKRVVESTQGSRQ